MELRDDDVPRRIVLDVLGARHAECRRGVRHQGIAAQEGGQTLECAYQHGLTDGDPLSEQPVAMDTAARADHDAGRDRKGPDEFARLLFGNTVEIDVQPDAAQGEAILQLAAAAILAVGEAEVDVPGRPVLDEKGLTPGPAGAIGHRPPLDVIVVVHGADVDLAASALEDRRQEILARYRERAHAAPLRSCSANSARSGWGMPAQHT